MKTQKNKTISLVLGSGGARGLAHIGVIHWLEEHDFRIKSISGCSMGALIGGVYAVGKLDDFENWIRAVTKADIVTLLDFSWRKNGLIKGDKIIDTLVELVGDQLIETLPVSFTAIAADIKNEKEVWIQSGQLFDAIRASISLPLFFTPCHRNGVDLIDGGVLNPVPIAPTFGDDTELTIAVNLGGAHLVEKQVVNQPADINPAAPRDKIKRYIGNFQQNLKKSSGMDWSLYDIANQAFDAMQSTIARQKLAAYPPDHTLDIARNACGTLEFDRANEMIALGYEKAQTTLAALVEK